MPLQNDSVSCCFMLLVLLLFCTWEEILVDCAFIILSLFSSAKQSIDHTVFACQFSFFLSRWRMSLPNHHLGNISEARLAPHCTFYVYAICNSDNWLKQTGKLSEIDHNSPLQKVHCHSTSSNLSKVNNDSNWFCPLQSSSGFTFIQRKRQDDAMSRISNQNISELSVILGLTGKFLCTEYQAVAYDKRTQFHIWRQIWRATSSSWSRGMEGGNDCSCQDTWSQNLTFQMF